MLSSSTQETENESVAQNEPPPASQQQTPPASQQPTGAPPRIKRKEIKKRSPVWAHFEQIKYLNGVTTSAKCNYCETILLANTKKNETSSLINHLSKCDENPHKEDSSQTVLNLQPNAEGSNIGSGPSSSLTAWKYDEKKIRDSLARMIIVDELPFRFVEAKGFNDFVREACPRFKCPSRSTITRDCFKLFAEERVKLKSFFKHNCQRVCLTTDTWTSIQRINYMCVTAHFIDNDWNLHKKIISFVPVCSHRGDDLAKALETVILDWGIKNVFSITVDNASSNETAISNLKKRIVNWGGGIGNCDFIHMRCIAHVINLIVKKGLKEINLSVKRVRDVIRFIRNSPARLRKFKECMEWEGIECKNSLCLDVATRWNSTYLMLSTAAKFERAFERYMEEDSAMSNDLGCTGVPSSLDWNRARKFADLLKYFYDLTLRISRSSYVTSSSLFTELSDLCFILDDWKKSDDVEVKNLGVAMKTKFDKYWGEPEKMNKLIFFANVFDPTDKMEYMDYTLGLMYGTEKIEKFFEELKKGLVALFDEYKMKYDPESASVSESASASGIPSSASVGSSSDTSSIDNPKFLAKKMYKKQKMEMDGAVQKKSELDVYLNEAIENAENLDVRKWWKINSGRFSVLSKMARDILAVPISTVASESTFSTGGRVLDAFRSSLTPKIVEALICTQNWLRGTVPLCVEELLEDLESLENDLPNVGIGQTSMI